MAPASCGPAATPATDPPLPQRKVQPHGWWAWGPLLSGEQWARGSLGKQASQGPCSVRGGGFRAEHLLWDSLGWELLGAGGPLQALLS